MSTLHAERLLGLPATGGGLMRRLNVVTAAGGGLVLGLVGWAIARHFMEEKDFGSDQVTVITMVCWAVGFMAGIGAFNGPIGWLRGRDLTPEDELFLAGKDQGIRRYFRFTTDHKVVGIQYLVLTMVLFGVGGTMAMLIRTNLISPNSNFLSPQQVQRDRRPARPDHDHRDDHHGDWPLRQLHHALDDRRPGHGVPTLERPESLADRRRRPDLPVGCVPGWYPDRLGRLCPTG